MTALARRQWTRSLATRLGLHRLEDRTNPDATYFNLAGGNLMQDWTSASLITANDNWSGVPSFEGYLGQDITTATNGTDPQTLLTTSAAANDLDVVANKTTPNTDTAGGVTEYEITNPTIALNGSGTADAPYLITYLNTTGRTNITVAYNVRDIDGSADNAAQQLALQYRVGTSGNFTNIPAAYIADATEQNAATLVTSKSIVLPAVADNQSQVQVRWITSNASGNDEYIGIDDILVSSSPAVMLSVNDKSVTEGNSGTKTVSFTVSLDKAAPAGGVTFDIATANGTASAGSDYVARSLTGQTIPAGESSYTFDVTVNGDTTIESDETFFVNVTNVVGASTGDGQGLGTITSDDPNTPPDIVGAATVTVQAFEMSTAAADVDATDPDPQTLTFSLTGGADKTLFDINPTSGVVTFKAAPDFEFPANMNNKYVVDVTVSDGAGGSDVQTITVMVNNVNEAPTFVLGGGQTANEDAGMQTVSSFATGISVGPVGDLGTTVTFTITNDNNALFATQPALDAMTGKLTYTPAADAFGTATVSVFAMDDGGVMNGGTDTTATLTFTITVTAVNDAPDFTVGVVPDVFEDSGSKTIAGFLTVTSVGPANESTQTAMASSVTNDNNALFLDQPAIDANGQLTYTPAADAFGMATVTVTVEDNGGGAMNSKTRTFTVVVTPVNDAPSFAVGPNQTADEDAGSKSVMNFIATKAAGPANESGQVVSFLVSNTNNALFTGQPSIDAAGQLTYTLKADANGTATVSVRAADNGGAANGGVDTSAPQTFTITVAAVNDAPTFALGGTQTVAEDGGAASVTNFLTALLVGPADEVTAGQTPTVTVTNNNTTLFAGQPTLTGGTLTFTPAANAFGTATVTVKVQDTGGGTDTTTQTFTINVTAVNDAPSFLVGPDQGVAENSPMQTVMNFLTMIAAGPPNEAGQTVTFLVTNDNAGLFAVAPGIAPNGTLTYTPMATATGMATVSVRAMDNGGGADTSAVQTFLLAIGPVNDAPSFTVGANQTVAEDAGPQTVAGFATKISAGPPDESSQVVTFQVSNTNAALFKVAPTIDASGKLTYTPADDANGTATITVTLMDDGGTAAGGDNTSDPQTFTITVNAVNDAPTFATLGSALVLEDAGAIVVNGYVTTVSAGPGDEAAQTVAVAVSNTTNAGLFAVAPSIDAAGKLTYTVAPDANGSATVTVTATDSGTGANTSTQTFTITVIPVNDAPTFTLVGPPTVNEDAGPQGGIVAKSIAAGPADEAGQAVTFVVSTTNSGLFAQAPTVDANGRLVYVPAADANGTAVVTVTATDDGGTTGGGSDTSKSQTFTINVNAVNDAPRFLPTVLAVTQPEDAQPFTAGLLQGLTPGAADEGGQTLSFEVSTDNPGFFSVQPALDAAGVLTYTVAPNAVGTAQITYTVRDTGGTANGGIDFTTTSFPVTVTPVNDAPTFSISSGVTVEEDAGPQTRAGFATAIAAGPADEAAQPLSFTFSTAVTSGDVSFTQTPAIDAAGNLTFQTAPDSNGTAVVTVTLDDGNGGTLTQTFAITVTPVNDAPTAAVALPTPPVGGRGTQSIPGVVAISPGAANETDAVSVAVNVVSTTGNLTFTAPPTVDATGTLTYTARRGSVGTATLAVAVNDGSASAPVQFLTVQVDATGRYELVGYPEFAVGSDDGQSRVTFFNPDGSVRFFSSAFPGTEFGARIATADFTGDGVADLVVGSGPGRITSVQVIDGVTQKTIFAIQPFETGFTGGVNVAAGDLTGDRIAELVITPDEGGGPRVRVFSGVGFGLVADFFGIDDPNFRGGARAAVGDMNRDGTGDLVVAAGFGGGPRVAGYDGTTLAGTPVKLFNDFFAFEASVRNGVFLAVGDVDGDGVAEIIAGGGPGSGPRVTAFDGDDLMASNGADRPTVFNFFAGDTANRGGIRLGVKDLDGDAKADLIVGSGNGAGDTVTAYLGTSLTTDFPRASFDFEAFDDFPGGVFVG